MRDLLYILLGIALSFLVVSCARVSSPTGGLKDEDPPVMESSKPAMNALGVSKQEITITFDEIIVLKELTTNFLVSPPTKVKPEVKAYADDIIVEFADTLQSNTTYTLYFGDAIVDNNEGNILHDYTFSFSTGYTVDTMRMQGYVVDASTLDPVSNIMVGIYSNTEDSAFTKDVPMRIALTNEDGWFSVNNVRPGQYMVRALNDMDNNFRFNQPGEMIAFNHDIYETSQGIEVLYDSVFTDSLGDDRKHYINFKEMRQRDSVIYFPDDIMLMAFVQDRDFQVLKEKKRDDENQLDFTFESQILESPEIRLLDDTTNTDWYVKEFSEDSLSVKYWVKDSALIMLDTISILFNYQVTDTLDQFVWQQDTMHMRFKRKKKNDRQKRKEAKDKEKEEAKEAKEEAKEGGEVAPKPKKPATPLKITQEPAGKVPYFGDITFTSPQPIASINKEGIRLYEFINDSTLKELKYKFFQDEHLARSYHMAYAWDQEKSYQVIIDSATIYDIYGLTNDSIGQRVDILTEDNYSTIFLNLYDMKGDAVVELIDGSKKVVASQSVTVGKGEVEFLYLKPNKYYVSLFYDANGNGKWDSGNFEEDIQAEERRYFNKVIEAKAYYEMVEDWGVEDLNVLEQKPEGLKDKKKK